MSGRGTGAPLARAEALEKVTGTARYAYERPLEGVLYAWIVGSTVARGRILALDAGPALRAPGVVTVLTHENAPRLQEDVDPELEVLQGPDVPFRGRPVALVVAGTLEAAREAARHVVVRYEVDDHDVVLRDDHPDLYAPEEMGGGEPTAMGAGEPDAAWRSAPVRVEATYRTPAEHNNPMEPHATTAVWEGDRVTLYDSTQGASSSRDTLAELLGLPPQGVRVVNEHVGGGFGSKGTPRVNAVLAAQAAKATGRPVKLAVTRQQMFDLTGYRTPTVQRLRLGADDDGRLTAIAHDAVAQTAASPGFLEPTTTPTRVLYGAPHRRSAHRVVALDVPGPSWLRAPGRCPGTYALESAMDELAYALGLDPVELRLRNDTQEDPEKRVPFSSRSLRACLEQGAERFGWADRDPTPGVRRDGRTLIGTGVAAATYPAARTPASATARVHADGSYTVEIGATDIGTGARTVLTQIAADHLDVDPDRIHMRIGDSDLPDGPVAGDSAGTASWGSAVAKVCDELRGMVSDLGGEAGRELVATANTADDVDGDTEELSRHAFGAHFAEVRVDLDTGEVRVPRMLGVFGVGRVLNPRTARSQFVGGMTMGMGMALHEASTMDVAFGDFLNHDLAQYHVPVNADVQEIDVAWVDEHDPYLNPMGAKGIGEIGIVGSPAAIGNAVFHATGVRFRELPLVPDRVLRGLRG